MLLSVGLKLRHTSVLSILRTTVTASGLVLPLALSIEALCCQLLHLLGSFKHQLCLEVVNFLLIEEVVDVDL